jgi:aspartate/methionine/tyrosine aminotransferase
LCKAHSLALVLDETYKDLREGIDHPPHALFARPDWQDVLVHLYSFSKVYALTGYRVGSLTAGQELQVQIAKVLDCITICAPHLGQRAALYGLQHLHAWQREKREAMRAKRLGLKQLFDKPLGGFRLVSCGAYFAYVQHPFADKTATQVAQHLAESQNILMLPGSMFGPEQERFLRIAFANLDAAQLPELGRRLQGAV